ncbi:30S ribosomal protein S9 [Nanoarchaeota archaeon]
MKKPIHISGTRKKAKARATLKEGKGMIRVNKKPIDQCGPEILRLKIKEPLILAGDVASKVDIEVNTFGGGVMSQAEAARLAIARVLVAYSTKLKKIFLSYDRNLLVADVRQRESRKPNTGGKARGKIQKSYR